MALTPKQEYFARLVASGKDYTTAYLTAYDWNGSKAGAANEALILANKAEVQDKIRTLVKPLEIAAQKDNITARQKQIAQIEERLELCKQRDDETNVRYYLDMLNKIYALYKETDNEQKQENTLSDLDISALKRLTGVS